MTEKKKSTKFVKGQSGNPAGRPKGSRGKLSDRMLLETLQRGDKEALEFILDLIKDKKENGSVRLRAAAKWLDMSIDRRDALMKKVQQEADKGQKESFEEEDSIAPVLKFVSSEEGE